MEYEAIEAAIYATRPAHEGMNTCLLYLQIGHLRMNTARFLVPARKLVDELLECGGKRD